MGLGLGCVRVGVARVELWVLCLMCVGFGVGGWSTLAWVRCVVVCLLAMWALHMELCLLGFGGGRVGFLPVGVGCARFGIRDVGNWDARWACGRWVSDGQA